MRSIGVGGLIGAALFLALGLAALVPGVRNVYRAFASRDWPSVPGVVVESATERSTTRESNRRTSTTYSAKTIVRYQVNGHEFTTGTRRFGQIEGSGDISDAVLEHYRFPVGAQVQVHHHPRRPGVATIKPGFHANALLLPLAGFAFFGAAVLVLAVSRGGSGTGAVATTFALIFCAIGAALLLPGLHNVWLAQQSVRWPTAPARIVYGTRPSEESPAPTDSADGDSVASDTAVIDSTVIDSAVVDSAVVDSAVVDSAVGESTAAGSLEESPAPNRLVYRFDANGTARFGNMRHFGQISSSSDEEWMNAIRERYALGQPVTASYLPSDPDVSVLEPGVSKEAWLLPGAGLAFLLFGLAVFRWIVPSLSR